MNNTSRITGRWFLALVATLLLGFGGTSVFAHKGASGVVKKRMDEMKVMKDQLKDIDKMLTGKKAFNDQTIRKHLDSLRDHGGKKMTKLFPKGSTQKPSEADPAIWKDWSAFEKMAIALNHSTDEFRTKLPTGKIDKQEIKQLQNAHLAIRKTCKTCHDRFRE